MRIKKKLCLIPILMLVCVSAIYPQEHHTEIAIDFRVNKTNIDSTYMNNAIRLAEMKNFLNALKQDSTVHITEVAFCGSASPEGPYQLNHRLARERLSIVESLVRSQIDIPDSLIVRDDNYIPWHYLREQVTQSDIPQKAEILAIIDSDSSLVDYHRNNLHIEKRIPLLQRLDNGRVWPVLLNRFFMNMREGSVVFVTYRKIETEQVPDSLINAPVVIPHVEEAVTDSIVPTVTETEEEGKWRRALYLKSNGIGWMMLISNGAVEVDLARHWSFTLPVYYSAMNYFSGRLKFRTFALQPELRYWFNEDNERWFIGAHAGFAYYNLALLGKWRIQDHKRQTPTLGGGLSAGYRLPLKDADRWYFEFSLGAGYYPLHYDRFYNKKNGALYDTKKMNFLGVDNAAISIVYRLGSHKKGGKR